MKRWGSAEWAQSMAIIWSAAGTFLWFLGAVFVILGVVSEATNTVLGLQPTSWLLLAIAIFAASMGFYLGWAVGTLSRKG